jgi:hypothetical protein
MKQNVARAQKNKKVFFTIDSCCFKLNVMLFKEQTYKNYTRGKLHINVNIISM